MLSGFYSSKWSKWFTLRMGHRINTIKVADQIELKPATYTADFFHRTNMFFKRSNDGYAVFFNDLQSIDRAVTLSKFPVKLCFEGKLNTLNFLKLSDSHSPANRIQVNYLNNLSASKIDKTHYRLHANEYVTSGDFEVLDLMPLKFDLKFTEEIGAEAVTFFDAMQQKEQRVEYVVKITENNQSIIHCDFSRVGEGAIQIQLKGKEYKKFYISGRKQIDLVIECFIEPAKPAPSLWKGKEICALDYFIKFDVKNTFWKYILVSRATERRIYEIEEVLFELNGERFEMGELVQTELVNGVPCLHIVSKIPQPLRVNTFNHEILKMKIATAKKWSLKSIRMPIPTYKNVQRTDRESGHTYTLIYVYI